MLLQLYMSALYMLHNPVYEIGINKTLASYVIRMLGKILTLLLTESASQQIKCYNIIHNYVHACSQRDKS